MMDLKGGLFVFETKMTLDRSCEAKTYEKRIETARLRHTEAFDELDANIAFTQMLVRGWTCNACRHFLTRLAVELLIS